MNKSLESLFAIGKKSSRHILGLMSGTSLDGLDIALCEINGSGYETNVSIKNFSTIPYDEDFRTEVRTVISKKQVDLEKVTLLNEWIALRHASMINDCLKNWKISNEKIDIIASHGQTIYHAPEIFHQLNKFGNGTLQIGDGDHIAVSTGIITISDFRQKHIAAGGEGAPLAVYGDILLFSKQGETRILLNIGGIANFTWLPGNLSYSPIYSSDTGPGNTLMDSFVQQNFNGKSFDKNAELAMRGKVNEELLIALKENHFFSLPFPKTTGPELFCTDYLQQAKERSLTMTITAEDTLNTLNKFTADTIGDAIRRNFKAGEKDVKVFVSGGGMHNLLLMQRLQQQLGNCKFQTTETLGIDPDAKEAVLFAVLANECICGDPSVFSNVIGMPAITMGKISFPG
ncbi:MAG: anhydro-N-acetylmuramic acid kinase [Ferruginibacter sp.]